MTSGGFKSVSVPGFFWVVKTIIFFFFGGGGRIDLSMFFFQVKTV